MDQNRNFTATVKDGEGDSPCYVHLEADADNGTGMRTFVLKLRAGTNLEDARSLASALNSKVLSIGLEDLYWPNKPSMQ